MLLREVCEEDPIYYVFDAGDKNFQGFYAMADDIILYLQDNLEGFTDEDSWIEGLEKLGLTYKDIIREVY